jgi:predicted metal-binding membrane protein
MIRVLPLRDRAVMLAGLALLSAISWAYLWRLADDHMTWCNVNTAPWGAADLAASFAMWAVMMTAMMIPSASPAILAFAGINRVLKERARPYTSTTLFLAGYLAMWAVFSLLATAAQEGLRAATLLSPAMTANSRAIARVLLIGAGVFQWTPLKNACLRRCRSPLGYLMTEWRDGRAGAFAMGLRYGLYCVGCCWLLMLLLFVVGVMNLVWVAALAAFVLVEKLTPAGPWVSRMAGLAMIAVAAFAVR